MKNYQMIIFDWAGTTVDYGCFAPVQAFEKVFLEYGIEPTTDEVRGPMGMLKWDHIRTMLEIPRIKEKFVQLYGRNPEDEDADAMYAKFEPALFEILETYTDVKPYVLETVEALRSAGIKIGSTTGYTDAMMEVVTKAAKEKGYAPDYWCSPDAVGGTGRPYPYMIFKNMMELGANSMDQVIKVGDTVSDIKEGKAAGVYTVGVIEGSSVVGLNEAEYLALSEAEKIKCDEEARQVYLDAGADMVIQDIRGVLSLIV